MTSQTIKAGQSEPHTELLAAELRRILGEAAVVTAPDLLSLYSSDVYSRGETVSLAIKPNDRSLVPAAIRCITDAGYAVLPRGGGMSYTGGYVGDTEQAVVIDTAALNQIVSIEPDDMVITVEAGVTWQQIYEALTPLGLRLPFFGTFSGSRATVGGGMSNGALFMGTGRYGTGAEIVLGLEVVTASGRVVKTGQAGFRGGKAFMRSFGPDLTGLFIHDAGALGLKTLVSMRMIRKPKYEGYASFVLFDEKATAEALSCIARSGRVEEAYVFDPEATRRGLDSPDFKADLKRLVNVMKAGKGIVGSLRAGAKLVGAGRQFVAENAYTLHVVAAGDTQIGVAEDLQEARDIVAEFGGGEIADSMPRTARANPFEPLNGVLGSDGDRWAALNAKVAHSDALKIIRATDKILEKHAAAMAAANVSVTRLFIAISNHVFSFEPVLRWYDEWLPVHQTVPEAEHLAKFVEPPADLAARELVATIRAEIVALFTELGAASNQIGRTYHYFSALDPETAVLVADLKRSLDPRGLMNPGVLELDQI